MLAWETSGKYDRTSKSSISNDISGCTRETRSCNLPSSSFEISGRRIPPAAGFLPNESCGKNMERHEVREYEGGSLEPLVS